MIPSPNLTTQKSARRLLKCLMLSDMKPLFLRGAAVDVPSLVRDFSNRPNPMLIGSQNNSLTTQSKDIKLSDLSQVVYLRLQMTTRPHFLYRLHQSLCDYRPISCGAACGGRMVYTHSFGSGGSLPSWTLLPEGSGKHEKYERGASASARSQINRN